MYTNQFILFCLSLWTTDKRYYKELQPTSLQCEDQGFSNIIHPSELAINKLYSVVTTFYSIFNWQKWLCIGIWNKYHQNKFYA